MEDSVEGMEAMLKSRLGQETQGQVGLRPTKVVKRSGLGLGLRLMPFVRTLGLMLWL